ncbi:MAG: HDOD domain-containing protein [Pseudomonadota bacterium]
MSELAESITTEIQTALDKDQLELPSLPEVALRIREEAESEHVSAVSLSKVVSEDPGLTAQLVRTANSPMFRATRSIDDLSQAISRLGVEYSANIVTGLAMQQMFQATSEMVDRKMRDVWKASCDVAAWSSILCKRHTKLRPDQATLAGLTHRIGVLPILGWVEENDHLIRDSLTLDRVIHSIHPTIGKMILQHWNFADEIADVPLHYMDIDHQSQSTDYVDIVCAAHLLQVSGFADSVDVLEVQHPDLPDQWYAAPALNRLGINMEMDEAARQDLRDEVNEVQNALR